MSHGSTVGIAAWAHRTPSMGMNPFHTSSTASMMSANISQYVPQQVHAEEKREPDRSKIVHGISYLSSHTASAIDRDLMSSHGGFSIDQLMELAGLSCACAIEKVYPNNKYSRVAIIVGPGNNGGDGLVVARHLTHFGYCVDVIYPKPSSNELYQRLCIQLQQLHIPIKNELPQLSSYQLIVDAIFGFSFNPRNGIREPFHSILSTLTKHQSTIPIISIDIPSGWDVDIGDTLHTGFHPSMLISLTAPKLCALQFYGIHYLGGRFVSSSLASTYDLVIPKYPGSEQCVELPRLQPKL